MKLTNAWLEKWEACSDGVAWFRKSGLTESSEVLEGLLKDKKLGWAKWLIVRLLDRKDKIRYAVFAAEQVIEIFEKKYPEDKRPRQAIEAAKAVLATDDGETRAAARAAGDAAWAAAWAAGDAGDAAWAAVQEKIVRYGMELHVKEA